MELNLFGTVLKLKVGDITNEDCDAIVNAANSSLLGGGGVDGAIHRKGGRKLDEECIKIRREKYPDGLPTGEAVITTGGNLKARYVIHTVGPIWKGGNYKEDELLRKSYINSLKVALENGIKTIAFPAISTGAYGYPVEKAAEESIHAVVDFLSKNKNKFSQICLVLYTQDIYNVYEKTLLKIKDEIRF